MIYSISLVTKLLQNKGRVVLSSNKTKKKKSKLSFFISLLASLMVFSALFVFIVNPVLKQMELPYLSFLDFDLLTFEQQNEENLEWSNSEPAGDISFSEFLDQTIFVGDSRTNGMKNFGFLSEDHVFALDGASHQVARTEKFVTLDGSSKKMTIAQAVAQLQPDRIIVSFGINGVAYMGEDQFLSEYEDFLDELIDASPNSSIVIQSILPVSATYARNDRRMANDIIDGYNAELRLLAKQKGCYFLDTSEVLKNEDGALAKEYDSGDGLHFNKNAYAELFEYLDEHHNEIP